MVRCRFDSVRLILSSRSLSLRSKSFLWFAFFSLSSMNFSLACRIFFSLMASPRNSASRIMLFALPVKTRKNKM